MDAEFTPSFDEQDEEDDLLVDLDQEFADGEEVEFDFEDFEDEEDEDGAFFFDFEPDEEDE